MTPRLALVSAPVSLQDRYGSLAGAASTEPSFGLACLAAMAQQAGAETCIIEAAAEGLTVDESLRLLVEFRPDLVGFSATTAGIVACGELAARAKTALPSITTLIGGCHATALPAETLQEFPAFDVAVIGEGEETLAEMIGRLAAGTADPCVVPGTARRDGSAIRTQPPRPLIQDLDSLPLPAWSLLRGFPRAFRPSPARILRWPCASIVLTRGCPNRCVFCDRSVFGNRCRAYSPAYAVRMIADLRTRFGVKEILIEDDTFVIAKPRVREFCERLLADRVDVTWSCLGRADRVDPDLLALMRRAGCWHISFGVESGDAAILEAMHKHLNLDQIRQAITWSRHAGLRTKGFFIVGFPNETEESLRKTRELACSLPLDDISVMQMTPFPGSELYAMADQFGTFARDWRKMNALNAVFVPCGFTRESLEAAGSRLLREFYLRPGVLFRQFAHAVRHPILLMHLLRGFRAFLGTLAQRKGRSP